MKEIIFEKNEIAESQKLLEKILKRNAEKKTINASRQKNVHWNSDLNFWFHSYKHKNEDGTEIYRNQFGHTLYPPPKKNQQLIQVNTPVSGYNSKLQGAFAKDNDDNLYLIHRGKSGNRKGSLLNNDQFLRFKNKVNDKNKEKDVLVISVLDPKELAWNISVFIKLLLNYDGTLYIDETNEIIDPERYYEGATKTISVNSYERDQKARQKCIDHYGLNCQVCDFNFSEKYGEFGKGFIHVHHIKPLSEINGEYEVDPIKDLRPVCPNCHAMLHRGQELSSLEELKTFLEAKR